MYKARTLPLDVPELVIPRLADDTEEAPWMVMGAPQFWATTSLAHSLDLFARRQQRPWYVGSLLPILYRRRGEIRKRQVAPDVFVAFVAQRERDSYDLDEEGVFPAFVLEVLSSSSARRDRGPKRRLYEALGAQEYALFAPKKGMLEPVLQGYRQGEHGRFEPWRPDAEGRLWSEVLELWLVAREGLPRAMDTQGRLLLTLEESETARLESEAARRQAELAAQREAAALRQAEQEIARLRAQLERGQDAGQDP